MKVDPFAKPTAMDKELLASHITYGDTTVDATCGNGYDTVFLAEKVGDKGRVYAFDIQAKAIESTRKKLEERRLEERVMLLKTGHEKMKDYVDSQVSVVMFNLGYLPGSDKQIVTKPTTSISAIETALTLIKPNGMITIVAYPGHDTGLEEAQHVEKHLTELDQNQFHVRKIISLNYRNRPPYLLFIHKL